MAEQQPIDITETKQESKVEPVPFESVNQNDSSLIPGKTKITTSGVNGERTIVYEVTYNNGVEVSRKEVSNFVTKQPVTQVTKVGTK